MELNLKIGLVGYGEVGKILRGKGLAWVGAWDVLFRDAVHGPATKARATIASSHAGRLRHCRRAQIS